MAYAAEETADDPQVRGTELRTQRMPDDSMRVERPQGESGGGVAQERVEDDVVRVNPDADSMESRG